MKILTLSATIHILQLEEVRDMITPSNIWVESQSWEIFIIPGVRVFLWLFGTGLGLSLYVSGMRETLFFLRDGASQKQRSAGQGRGRAKLHKSILLQISDKRFLANGNSSKKCIWFCVSFAATLFRAFPKSGVGRPFLHFTAIYLYLVQDERADVQFYEAVQNWWPMTYTGSTHVRLK